MAKPDAGDLDGLEKAVNDAAGKASALWLSFISFATLLIITVGSVTHRHLFLEQDLQLAVINVKLPLVGFFFAAPLFFVVFHFYALLQLQGLATKVAAYNERLLREVRVMADRRQLRLRLDPFVFVQMTAGARERRSGRIGSSNRLVAWITIVGLPLATVLLIQLTFLPYHHTLTWLHRGAVGTDLFFVWVFWRALAEQGSRPPGAAKTKAGRTMRSHLRGSVKVFGPQVVASLRRFSRRIAAKLRTLSLRTRWPARVPPLARVFAIIASLCVGAFSILAAYPTETIYPWTRGLTAPIFEGKIDTVAGKPKTLFGLSNKLVLPDQDFGLTEKLKAFLEAGEPERATLSLRGRDLAGAVLDRVDLRQADFTGSVLSGASLKGAKLVNARFGCGTKFEGVPQRCAHLERASLDRAELQGASFVQAHLQGASLAWAELQGASLIQAQLQGAYLAGAQLQGASLKNAQLQGAVLFNAQLQGALLQGAELQGAILNGAGLQGASLEHAQLQGAYLWWAQLQGALLMKAQLQGASLTGANLKDALLEKISAYRLNCTRAERFHQCDSLKAAIGTTHHRQFELDRSLQGVTPLGTESIVPATPWRYQRFVSKVIDGLPTEASKQEVRARLSVLDPVGYSHTKDEIDKVAWQTDPAARGIPLSKHTKARAKLLRDLACNSDAAPHVARGLLRNDARSIEQPTAGKQISEKACPGSIGLTARDLRTLAAWFDMLEREVAKAQEAELALARWNTRQLLRCSGQWCRRLKDRLKP
jgi:uncharacterized protein YjbI with pentapeptide repeats